MMMAPTTISEHIFIGVNFLKFCPIRLPENFRRGCSSPAKIWMRGNLCGQCAYANPECPAEINITWSRWSGPNSEQTNTRERA